MERIQFSPGDILVFYTDGLTESRNENNEEYSLERLKSLLTTNQSKSAEEFLAVLKKEVKEFSKGTSHDDMTIIVLKKDI